MLIYLFEGNDSGEDNGAKGSTRSMGVADVAIDLATGLVVKSRTTDIGELQSIVDDILPELDDLEEAATPSRERGSKAWQRVPAEFRDALRSRFVGDASSNEQVNRFLSFLDFTI